MSSAELSVDIAQLVSRARNGEAVDATVEGETLAARYPGLGMSSELIGKAVVRAASMMGVALHGPEEPVASPEPGNHPDGDGELAGLPPQAETRETFDPAEAPALFALQDETPTPAGPDIAERLVGKSAGPILLAAGDDAALPEIIAAEPAPEPDEAAAKSVLGRPVAALRRAFFGG
ncbi:MAG: hypothetical protein M3453_11390 [Pseudomonadota bacterium]|nr:hypothetical protein [Pseudomonadota bacterium]